ncbi:hypothetical protein [Leucobacter aridicollis]|uniref:hypothetical protein n=1 Tax=Leucobacter aridicollis TaxID=283878 RepID=UPI00210775B4|nr:hypothetical protein [Leucobacter aridicollis]UTX53452.1 hypothetical protein KI794_01445 [Leucobacter aridicollis]
MNNDHLLEVWGDTVDSRHLLASIGLGVGIAVPAYFVAEWGFGLLTDGDPLAHSYSLVSGLAACVLAAVIAARFFKPKRVVRIGEESTGSREAAMDAIEAELGPLGDPDELPAATLAEVRELGLYDDLRAQHLKNVRRENELGESK